MTHPAAGPGVRRLLAGVGRLADDATPGQRWTAALALGLAVLVLAFGLPQGVRTVVAPAAIAGRPAGGPVPSPAAALGGLDDPAPTASGTRPADPVPIRGPAPEAPTAPSPAPGTTARAGIVAVAFGDPGDESGDRAVARHFLEQRGVDAEILDVDAADPTAACPAVAGRALVVAGGPLPAGLRECAVAAGARTLAFDDDLVPAAGRALSTRRGVARSLLDTAGELGADLPAPVVLVADERYRPAVEAVRSEAAERGLPLSDAVYLPDDAEPPPTTALELARSGPRTVVFATTTERQAELAARLSLLAPGVAYVVLDAADSVLAGAYPLVLDGARAVTTVQFPWHDEETGARDGCRASWAEVAGDEPLEASVLLRVLTWCQHVGLAAVLEEAGFDPSAEGVAGRRFRSTITAPLAVVDGVLGPLARTLASWSFDCTCWSAEEPFEEPS